MYALLSVAENRVLHNADLSDLFFVAGLDSRITNLLVSLADDSNQKVEKQNNIEDSTHNKYEPILVSVATKTIVKFTQRC